MPNNVAYIDDYNKKNYKMYQFRIKKDNTKIIDSLDKMSNRNNYIVSLINKDLNGEILTLKEIKLKTLSILKKHNIKDVYLFGSYARGEANIESDVDIYCEKGDIKTIIDQEMIEEELEISLNKKVDIVFIGSKIGDYFREKMMEDLIKLC